MTRKLLFYFFVCNVCVIFAKNLDNNNCVYENEDSDDIYFPIYNTGVSDHFDWNLFKELSLNYKNLIYSPTSLKTALALIYEGATGITEQQFRNVLHFDDNKQSVHQKYADIIQSLKSPPKQGICRPYSVNFGTRIFIRDDLKVEQKFSSQAEASYDAKVDYVKFSNSIPTAQKINAWVSEVTEGNINGLVKESDIKDVMMMVANAIYFKGMWLHQFPKNQTHTGPFYLTPEKTANVEYMVTSESYYFADSKELDAKLLRIPYKGKKMAMILVLPHAKAGLDDLIKRLDVNKLTNVLNTMDPLNVQIVLPKFKFNFETEMSSVLKRLGLASMFENTAGLSGIVRGQNLKLQISDIIQKSGIDVDEEGSTAFAASSVSFVNKFGEINATFNATHPFLFYIEDQVKQNILFIGKVMNPGVTEKDINDDNYIPLAAIPQSDVQNKFGDNEAAVPNKRHEAANGFQDGNQQSKLSPPFLSPTFDKDEDSNIIRRFHFFDLELLDEVTRHQEPKNVFLSSMSIKAVLGMLWEGARDETAEEIRAILRLSRDHGEAREQLQTLLRDVQDRGDNDFPPTRLLEIANAFFASKDVTVNKAYVNSMTKRYNALIKTLDLSNPIAAAKEINDWVNNKTRGLIPDIISPDILKSNSHAMVIANALYFKGLWLESFDPADTRIRPFHVTASEKQDAYMMLKTATLNYKHITDTIDAHVLELPYSDKKHAMAVILPASRNDLRTLLNDLQHSSFAEIINALEMTEVTFEIPKFEIEYELDLSATLKALKIQALFDRSKANLKGIGNSSDNLYVSNMFHKTKIEVNEQGTIAAASTASVVVPLMGSTTQRMVADHPFVFVIYKIDTRNVIFEGVVNNPLVAAKKQQRSFSRGQRLQQ